jgi:hypothetical protein
MDGTRGGILFVIVGVVLVVLGHGLLINRRGAQDWLLGADERRFRRYGKGTSLVRPSRRGVKRFGAVILLLGCAFVVGGVSAF